MAADTEYKPVPYIYKSRGVIARDELDQAPEYAYLDFLGCQERNENSVSSRYGQIIVNRDAVGAGTYNNYFFDAPVTTITRLGFQSSAWRYVGLQDGTLQRITGTGQGAFTEIYTGLSGNLFGSLVTNCFETSQPFLFIYDSNASIKDMGTGTPELTGLDPSPFTANAVPYSPLLTLIDNFATGNTYTTSGVSGWAWANLETLTATSGQIVTDFSEFFNIQQTGGTSYTPSTDHASAGATANVGTPTATTTSGSVLGFTSAAVGANQTVNATANVQGSVVSGTGTGNGSASAVFQYSTDSGATWTPFFSWNISIVGPSQTYLLPAQNITFPVPGIANISTLQMRLIVTASTGGASPPSVSVAADINSSSATITPPGTFGVATQGMLSVLNTNTTINVPIVSVVSSGFASGFYETLTVTTQAAHGRSPGDYISVYGSSNDLVDGYYQVVATPSSNTLTIYYNVAQGIRIGSAVYLSATGGFIHGGAAAPSTCVLNNLWSTPYPAQMSAWGFYQQVPTTTANFPIGAWSGTVAANATGTIGATINLDLSINNEVTDDDLIVVTLAVGTPANIGNIRLQFDVAGSGYTSSYYYKDITPAYYQGNIANTISAYNATEQQILGDTLGLFTGAVPNSTTAQLQPGNISTGSGSWAAIYLRRGDFLPVGNAGESGLDWSAITGWQLVVTTLTTGTSTIAANGLYLQWGYGPSSFAGVGYDYRFTPYDANTGTEGNPSPIMSFSQQFGYLSSLTAPFFLRQAAQVTGYYFTDPQVTHVRMYRRGGTQAGNWYQIDEFPNNPGLDTIATLFSYKDVIPDASLAEADILILDNDPPVTSSLVNPINTTLSRATVGSDATIYSVFNGQTIYTGTTIIFTPGQVVLVGNANNLEIVTVIAAFAPGTFNAVLRLQHNAGEPVIAYSLPRVKCNLCALINLPGGNTQVLLAGDPNNPNYVYYSKPGQPENFGPQNYVKTQSSDETVMAIINWRGTPIMGTNKTWYTFVGGAQPYLQPTGSQHGIVAVGGWAEVEGAVWFRSSDGLREFTGADGVYKSLPIEWVYRNNTNSLIPLAVLSEQSQDVMCYYQNQIYTSYISQNGNTRYRVIYDRIYDRFRYDDVPATAMFWEKETNTFLIGTQVPGSAPGTEYCLSMDQVYTQDWDDGGWTETFPGPLHVLYESPINVAIQHPYRDLGKPHFPKQWNMFETDVNTNGMVMTTTILFDDASNVPSIVLADQTTTNRQKVQFTITGQPDTGDTGSGQQAYRASIRHTFQVTAAPTLYQEDIYAAVLADLNSTYDTYWIKFEIDESKFAKEFYADYTSPVAINGSVYADNSQIPYWTFTLPALTDRAVQRVRFGNVNPGTTAFTFRTWRMILISSDVTQPFQLWAAPRVAWKTVGAGHTFQIKELEA